MSKLLRGGRVSSYRKDVLKYTSSIRYDVKLFTSVIKINQAHVIMLVEEGVITKHEGRLLLKALSEIKRFQQHPLLEDVHMYIEEEVVKATDKLIGGNLHIAKSRNDQVSTAIRMELRLELIKLVEGIADLQEALLRKASGHLETLFPGYTHLQPAQPVTLAHCLASYFDVLERGSERIRELYRRVNKCPMGACALATTSFPINRSRMAELLSFDGLVENSIDAVGSRDFLLEALAVLTITAADLSRMVGDLIIWSTQEFSLVMLPDDFLSTSSIMPQKKNPDLLEVIRARMSHVQGCFLSVTSGLNAMPYTYNMDFQEFTPRLWESLREVTDALGLLSKLYPSITVSEKCFEKLDYAFTTSTELANTLTRSYGVPFRTAHKTVGGLVKYLVDRGLTPNDVSAKLLKSFFNRKEGISLNIKLQDIKSSLDPKEFVLSHSVDGGPAPWVVSKMLERRKETLHSSKMWIEEARFRLIQGEEALKRSLRETAG